MFHVYIYLRGFGKDQNDEGERGREKSKCEIKPFLFTNLNRVCLTYRLDIYSTVHHDLIIPEDERTPEDEHVTSPDQLVQSIKYNTLELDKESESSWRTAISR